MFTGSHELPSVWALLVLADLISLVFNCSHRFLNYWQGEGISIVLFIRHTLAKY